MRISLSASLLVALLLLCPVGATSSAYPQDSEGSGYDMGSSGSGEWSEPGEAGKIMDQSNRRDQTLDGLSLSSKDFGSKYVTVPNSKSIWENNQIVAGIAAGGVAGMALAALLAGLLIYSWHKKDEGGYIQGQQTHRKDIV